ncbi:26S proteasome non-ATPase regulatory subunit 13-like protein A, partial [Diplonema papillatum]
MALTHLDSLKAALPSASNDIDQFVEYFQKKYWHELTEALLAAVRKPEWDNAQVLLDLYTNFITHFQLKISLFKLGQLLQIIAGRQTSEKAIEILSAASALVKTNGDIQAHYLLNCEEAYHKVQLGDVKAAKSLIEAPVTYLDKHDVHAVNINLRANIYRAQAAIYKSEKNYDMFYKTCLFYVAHVKTDELPESVQQGIAFDLGIAALLGTSIHNFGELIHHPILQSLRSSSNSWLAELLQLFNAGNLDEYNAKSTKYANEMKAHLGENNAPALRHKIQLMALLQHLFSTPVSERNLSFDTIAHKCRTDTVKDVEPLLLRALALDLIRGSIDEVDRTVE